MLAASAVQEDGLQLLMLQLDLKHYLKQKNPP